MDHGSCLINNQIILDIYISCIYHTYIYIYILTDWKLEYVKEVYLNCTEVRIPPQKKMTETCIFSAQGCEIVLFETHS